MTKKDRRDLNYEKFISYFSKFEGYKKDYIVRYNLNENEKKVEHHRNILLGFENIEILENQEQNITTNEEYTFDLEL